MATEHTPGPWHAMCDWVTAVFVSGGPGNDDIAELNYSEKALVSITREEAEANARLIAAAPALYEALNECADKLWVLRCNSRDAKDREAAEKAFAMATAALKLAGGQHD